MDSDDLIKFPAVFQFDDEKNKTDTDTGWMPVPEMVRSFAAKTTFYNFVSGETFPEALFRQHRGIRPLNQTHQLQFIFCRCQIFSWGIFLIQ